MRIKIKCQLRLAAVGKRSMSLPTLATEMVPAGILRWDLSKHFAVLERAMKFVWPRELITLRTVAIASLRSSFQKASKSWVAIRAMVTSVIGLRTQRS